MPLALCHHTLAAACALALAACVSEGSRPGPRDGDGDSHCSNSCSDDYPSPPPCFLTVWDEASCTCSLTAAEEEAPCDDGNACTLEDRCRASTCSGRLVDLRSYCDDGDDCTDDNCDQILGCVHDPAPEGELCDDGNRCTFDSRCNPIGRCRWTNQYVCALCDPESVSACAEENLDQDACDGRLVCRNGFCEVDPATVPRCHDPRLDPCLEPGCSDGTCTTRPLPDDTLCSDLSSCTKDDVCISGTCTGTPTGVAACACDSPEDCSHFDDGDLCNGGYTCRAGICVFDFASIVACDTSLDDGCSVTRCEPTTGECVPVELDDDSPCDDGDPCTVADACAGGVCAGAQRDCSELDGRCIVGVCDRLLGCTAERAPAGSECDAAEPCTSGGRCDEAGDCVAPVIGCDDGDPCTVDICEEDGRTCRHVGPEPPVCDGAGVCAGGVPLRCELGEYLCDYASVAGWSAVEKCDGADDDCDGLTDDDCIAGEACDQGTLLAAWSGTMQACSGATAVADASCGSGWHACTYSAMVDSLAGDAPPAGFFIAASIAYVPGAGYTVHDQSTGACFEFDGVCTNAREVQAMSWDGVFGATVAYAAEAWGCANGLPEESCETVVFDGVMCCADTCDRDSDCVDGIPCTADRCVGGRCVNDPGEVPVCKVAGVCRGLAPTCEDDGTFACRYDPIEGYEAIEATCDALDNDCDGKVDAADVDFAAIGDPCELQAGVCEGATKRASACVNGIWRMCRESDYAAHSLHYEDAFEGLCDERDNNCDGLTDAGFARRGVPLGGACDGEGVCGAGVVECAPSRTGAVCSSEALGSESQATPETCNRLDDDCDGETDERADLDPDDAACGTVGVCAGLVLGRCDAAGQWRCDTAAVPGFGAEACDYLDNDCDGETDEGFTAAGKALGASCGPPACPNGVVVCAAGGGSAQCSSDLGLELCDDVDNDCDGQTDEGVTYIDPVSGGARTVGQSCNGRGACGAGVVECGPHGAAVCSTHAGGSASQATLERCNGGDDDCDGLTDEGFSFEGHALGQSCPAVGACDAGTVVCASDGARATCSTHADGTTPQAAPETCDGRDDDCDGATDEAVTPGPEDCPVEGVCRPEMLFATCNGAAGWTCDHSGNPYYQRDDETGRCDRLDNDCDGLTDEDFPTLGEACDGPDPDACALGVLVCHPTDPTTLRCAGDFARAEVCNGIDDDCDGETDEAGAGGCTVYYEDLDLDQYGSEKSRCACELGGGYTAIAGGDCQDGVDTINPGMPELCNGVDDDCDGKTDAADAADLVVDDVVPCERQLGVCAGTDKGANRCVGGQWQPCQASDYLAHDDAYQADKETRCDGKDNDCDGASDIADPDVADAPPLCELQQGQCTGSRKPLALCTAAGWGPCTTEIYTAHAAAYEAGSERSCDAKDNDCDGLADDDFLWETKKVGQSCDGTGACGLGTVECRPDKSGATCSTNPDGSQPQSQPETCNSVDDDCDGAPDDGLGLEQSPCRKVGVCAAGTVLATCAQGAWACDYSAVAFYEATTEASCDERDNDCDNATDEDMSVVIGGQTLKKGDPCGSGACAGAVICADATPAPGDLVCSSEVGSGGEVCDGLDNDCDGMTDEGMTWTPPGSTPLALGATCDGIGACGQGIVECSAAGAATCSTNPDGSAPGNTSETCNGLDDDCDGTSDEGFEYQGTPVGESCNGIGACGVGVVECIAQGQASTCSTDPDGSASEAGPETCNGLDDDCDFETDEGLGVEDSDCALTGVCTVENVIATCTGDGGWQCDYSAVPNHHAGDEIGYCDGLDNDCDGATDEDNPELGEPCDLPNDPDLCFNGTWQCGPATTPPAGTDDGDADGEGLGGEPYCAGDTPSPEVCGGGDEDCDGIANEEGAQGCTVYFKDGDRDEYGKLNDFKCLCSPGAVPFYTATSNENDCNDGNANIHPHAIEACNEADDDCDGQTDEDGTPGCEDYYYDGDGDEWGLVENARCLCFAYQGEATGHTTQLEDDCDDEAPSVHPTAPELCDGIDNDCDGASDDADPPVTGCHVYFYDNDGDQFGVTGNSQCRCLPAGKYTALEAGDCCDLDNRTKPRQEAWFPSVDACGTFDYNCINGPEKRYPSAAVCRCLAEEEGGDICGTTTCHYIQGWVSADATNEVKIPACGELGSLSSGCAFNPLKLACEASASEQRQTCH